MGEGLRNMLVPTQENIYWISSVTYSEWVKAWDACTYVTGLSISSIRGPPVHEDFF